MDNKPTLMSLFSGAGCFDFGFKTAGFDIALSLDSDFDSCQTLGLNSHHPVLCEEIRSISTKNLMNVAGLKKRQVDILVGGPPCQPFSKCSYGSLGEPLGFEDIRANTLIQFMRVVRESLPRCFVIENVPHFISGKNITVKEYLQRAISYINRVSNTNYRLNIVGINAANYGVPQIRERVFIIASCDGHDFILPEIEFHSIQDNELGLNSFRTAWDAIGHLCDIEGKSKRQSIGGKWGNLLNTIPPGKNYLWHTKEGGGRNIFKWRSRYWNFLLKLHPDLPSWTIPAQPGQFIGPFHWENRKLTIKEAALLQTIPESYKFFGSERSKRKQIGNGVPSAIGELIGKEIRKQFFGEYIADSYLKLIPQKRRKTQRFKDSIHKKHHIASM